MGLAPELGEPGVTAFPAVDSITIASVPLPGKWTLMRAPKVYGWQEQQAFGMSGAVLYPKGDPLVRAEFRGEIWAESDVILFGPIRDKLLSNAALKIPGGLLAAAMGIDHPELKALGVTTIVIGEIDPLIQIHAGLWATRLVVIQYRPPVPAVKKPALVIPDAAPPLATAKTALEVQLQIAGATAEALTGALLK